MVNKKLKRFEEKHALFLVCVLLAVLILGSLLVMKPKMTGFAVVIEGYEDQIACEEDGYFWYEYDSGCYDVEPVCDVGFLELCNETECADALGYWYNEKCNAELEPVCDVDHLELCLNETTCTDALGYWYEYDNTCYDVAPVCDVDYLELCLNETTCTDALGHWYNEECNAELEPVCDVDHLELCLNETTCTDALGHWYEYDNTCYDVAPVCDVDHLELCLNETNCTNATGYWYNNVCNAVVECIPETSCGDNCGDISDGCGGTLSCGECDDDDDDTSSDVTGSVVDTDNEAWGSTCVSAWECGEWTECVGGTQTRECTDSHNCIIKTNEPEVNQSCEEEVVETPETCFDGMKNQDEKGIDCGGVCEQRCSLFTIIGNVVNVPINSSKQFVQNNKTITFSILGIIVLALSWIVCVKFVLKKKDIFFFVKNIHLYKDFTFFKRKKNVKLNNINL